MKVRLHRPWLIADLGAPHRVLSWSLNRPGFSEAQRIIWREVQNADLPPQLDVGRWLSDALRRASYDDAVCLLTSRDIGAFIQAEATVENETAQALVTVGLGNAERVGARTSARFVPGTINMAIAVSTPLADGALVEALSLAVEARSLALLEARLPVAAGHATGTGTDCAAVAAPAGDTAHAGKHTAIGEAVGRAALEAMRRGVADWLRDNGGGETDA